MLTNARRNIFSKWQTCLAAQSTIYLVEPNPGKQKDRSETKKKTTRRGGQAKGARKVNNSMTQNLIPVKSNEFGELNILIDDGKELFPATPIAEALGYSNPHKAIADHCKNTVKRRTNDSLGRRQEANYIPEGDVYRLIVRSNLPAAEKFEKWIFEEVLPSIRKTGSYSTKPELNVKALPSVNHAVSLLHKTFKVAGGNPASLGNMVVSLYRGIGVPVPALEAKVEEHLFDSEEIAAKIGILSESGKPHSHATKAVIRDLGFTDDDGTISTYERNGHSGTVVKYPPSVVDAVIEWFERKNWPRVIVLDKAYKVRYNP